MDVKPVTKLAMITVANNSFYRPLASPTAIRLLILEPDAADTAIRCRLLVVKDLETGPAFEALSYCWGSPFATRKIQVDDKIAPYTVSENLFFALLGLRRRDQQRRLWIDAMCINQHDHMERGQQVAIMRLIYAQSSSVTKAGSPDGNFVAEPTAIIDNTEAYTTNQVIDPAAFHDPKTGKYYLYWGNGKPLFAELADDMISLSLDTIAPVVGLENFTEASFVVYRAPYYHFTYPKGDTGLANYTVHYATATKATDPWTYRGVVLTQDPKHGILSTGSSGTVKVPGRDEWYIAYYRFQTPGGDGVHRETCIDKVTFDNTTSLMKPVIPTLLGVKPLRRRS